MTDPDKRNIIDERYHRDAVLRYLERTEPKRTHAGWLAHFKQEFDGVFIVSPPEGPGCQWRAVLAGGGGVIFEPTPTGLLAEMREVEYQRDEGIGPSAVVTAY